MARRHVKLLMVLDESASMANIAAETIQGVNQYVEKLAQGSDARIDAALMQFATTHRVVRPLGPIRSWKPLTEADYQATGASTALYDAVGDLYTMVQLIDDGKPVMVVVVTDGLDNGSYRHTKQAIATATQQLEKLGHFTFAYLGANQDAWAVGSSINYTNTYTWKPANVVQVYHTLTESSVTFCNSTATATRSLFTTP